MAAERMRLRGRGLVRSGYAADLVIFDPETIACGADAASPAREPVGIEHVMVNGTAVVASRKWCGDNVMAGEWVARASPRRARSFTARDPTSLPAGYPTRPTATT